MSDYDNYVGPKVVCNQLNIDGAELIRLILAGLLELYYTPGRGELLISSGSVTAADNYYREQARVRRYAGEENSLKNIEFSFMKKGDTRHTDLK
jgi:hypothetical protein